MKETTHTLQETAVLAKRFCDALAPRKASATVVGLYGDLGAGKTTFVQAVAKELGVVEAIQSPTFVILKRYTLHDLRYTNFIHIDAYRLERGEEINKLGFQDMLRDPGNLIVIEWPEKIADAMPEHLKIFFVYKDETTRDISFGESVTR